MLHSTCLNAHRVISGCRTQETERVACMHDPLLCAASEKCLVHGTLIATRWHIGCHKQSPTVSRLGMQGACSSMLA